MNFSRKALAAFAIALGALVLGFALTLNAAQDQRGNTPTSHKVIKDPAEYNAYIAALNTKDAAQKAQLMEAFAKQYPDSIVKIDALEQAMAAYQQANNPQKLAETAVRILEMDPNNIRALAITIFLKRATLTATTDATQAAALSQEIRAGAEKGAAALKIWPKPEDISDAEFEGLRNQMTSIFCGALGFVDLRASNWASARENLMKAVRAGPDNMQDIYQLSVAELEMNPPDVNGFWYAARAIHLFEAGKNAAAANSITQYAKAKYKKFHGGEDGWDQILAQAATQTAPPANFAASIKRAPTVCELAVQAVQENDPATLSFSDWEFILAQRDCSPAARQAAQKVWAAILAKQDNGKARLKIHVKVISSTADTILVAITGDNQQANKADMKVTLTTPMQEPPAPGAMIDVIGVLTRYTSNPFLFVMEKGEVQ